MQTSAYIANNRQLPHSQDFEFLRQEGMKYIEQLGHKLWTDYNKHDPGITILEVLCYAITELGYRADFDIKNLVADKNGAIKNNTFFPASEIFTNAPLTEIDYRKLLIDIPGVANAWFLATTRDMKDGFYQPNANEIPIYINKLEDKLSLNPKDRNNTNLATEATTLHLRGLNKTLIELDEDPRLGDLNSTILEYEFPENGNWVQVTITPQSFSLWNDTATALLELMNDAGKIKMTAIESKAGIVTVKINRLANIADELIFSIEPYDPSEINLVNNHFAIEQNIAKFILLLDCKKKHVDTVFANILQVLNLHRNLAEDFLCVKTIDSVQIGVCADIELEPQSNVVDVMAQVQLTISNVINPPIRFYTLAQLLAEGYQPEDIFLGPRLKHGFLKDEELIKATLPTAIHTSDIIAALIQVKGVLSVGNMLLSAYDKNGKVIDGSTNMPWCLHLSGKVNAIFNDRKSKLLLFQKGVPFLLSENNQMLVDQKVMVYKAQQQNYKLQNVNNELPFPTGEFFQLDEHYSIQDDFPAVYGTGKNVLSDKVTDKRKAQVKQLKGYLHFYDQLLGDFFSQLYHAKELLDTNPLIKTYFPKYLDINDHNDEDYYSKMLYAPSYKADLLNLAYNEVSIYEHRQDFYERRNRALDHLMARFCESFNDYVFMMYEVNKRPGNLGELTFQYEDLIKDKENFINQYQVISSQRGLGIDYLNVLPDKLPFTYQPFWDTSLRGGYEKRVAKLLGINNIGLRDIVTETAPQAQWTINAGNKSVTYKILWPNVNLDKKWGWVQFHILDSDIYKIEASKSTTNPGYCIYLFQDSNKIAKIDAHFSSYAFAYKYLNDLIQVLSEKYENFYCLEHILLRPFPEANTLDTDLLTVCLNDDCASEANNDPYSFKATIVLPGYLYRFRNMAFRKYAEKIFRQEAPAHVLLKICWVNIADMAAFQVAYKEWLEHYGPFRVKRCNKTLTKADIDSFLTYHKNLLTAFNDLNTIYPEGNLFDCQTSKIDNPIILGNTALGTL